MKSEWQPVESVPDDSFPRLYFCSGVVVQGFKDATGRLWVQQEHRLRQMRREPTHWMPLPEPPR